VDSPSAIRYSDAYASNQFQTLQQFFRWLAEEEQLPDPMTRLRAPKVTEKLVPVFSSGELAALEKTCQGRSFVQRRDAALIAVLTATGIRAAELAGIRYDPCDPRRSDLGLESREITVHGKGGRTGIVRIGYETAPDWYLRVRHAQAWRAAAVAGREQPRADNCERDLPGDTCLLGCSAVFVDQVAGDLLAVGPGGGSGGVAGLAHRGLCCSPGCG
jgi:hypothetical protein